MNQATTALTGQNELLKHQLLDLSANTSQLAQKILLSKDKPSKFSKPVTGPEDSIASRQKEAPGQGVTVQSDS